VALQQDAETPRALKTIVWPVTAYSVIYTLLFLIVNLLPIYTGVFIDVGGLSEVNAGWVNSTFLATMTIAAIAFTFVLAKFSLRRLGFAATAVMLVGLCIPLVISGPGAVVLAMAVAGVGNGALFAIVNASAAMEKHPVLIYGAGIVLSNLATAAVPNPLYKAVDAWGVSGLFVPPLVLVPLVGVSLLVLKRRSAPVEPLSHPGARVASSMYSRTAVALLVAVFLTNLFLMAYYAFADRLLVNLGADSDAISVVFTVVYFAAAVAGVIAMIMARWPRGLVIGAAVFTAVLAISILVATTSHSSSVVSAAIVIAGGVSMLNMSVQLGVAANIDPSGRVAAAASGAQFGAWTLGPILGGWLLAGGGFGSVAVLTAVLGALSVALLVVVKVKSRSPLTSASGGRQESPSTA
jgi:MFS family permease